MEADNFFLSVFCSERSASRGRRSKETKNTIKHRHQHVENWFPRWGKNGPGAR